MRTRVFGIFMFALLTLASGNIFGQTPEGASQTSPALSRIVGVVTAIDKSGNVVTVKSDAGESVAIRTNSTSALLRLPPGETSSQKAVKITLADIAVGERLFARGTSSADGKSLEARQVVVTGAAASSVATQDPQRQNEDFRQRGLFGRITAIDSVKKEISVQSRSRENAGPIAVVATDATRFFRYAPDSMNIKDAARTSLAEVKVGDQLRALGTRSEDGTRFTADEIIVGSMARTAGHVVAVNPAANELTLKNVQGETVTVTIGPRSSLRRVTPEAAASFEANRPQGQAGGRQGGRGGQGGSERGQAGQAGQAGQEARQRERRDRSAGPDGEQRRPRGGRGFQEMLESLPAITIADLKKGDTVFVSGSEGANPSRLTAIMLVTGDPEFMSRFLQSGPNRGPQSPGLPGDVMGGGVGNAERPPNP